MTYWFFDTYIPDRMMPGLERYINEGIMPGHFLTAVLENDLAEAFGRADTENLKNMRAYVGYLYNEAPIDCWGSPAKVREWIEMGGLKGKRAAEAAREESDA